MVNNIESEKLAEQYSSLPKNTRHKDKDIRSELYCQNGPPAIDESWWDAVLAEEDARSHAGFHSRQPNHANGALNRQRTDPLVIEPQLPSQRPAMSLFEPDWEKALKLYHSDHTTQMKVTSYNRGGLLVSGDGLQGFVPVSHLVEAPLEAIDAEKWLATYLDRSLRLKIIECDPDRGRVVFSERAALAESGARDQLLNSLTSGACVAGAVTNITDFGVFVDLGGVEGLVHVSEISWGRVHHPGDVVRIGQEVKVYVINVEPERARVALSLKRLYPNPWETAHERYFPGQITDAVITSIVPFGAFARLEQGLDGLIHVSEMANNDLSSQERDRLHEGQCVKVRVLHVDSTRQRLGLSLMLDGDSR